LKARSARPKAADSPKAEGSLWSLPDEAKPSKPQLWKPASKSITGLWRDADVEQKKQKLLWSQKAAKRTTEKKPERHEATYKPSYKPVVKVSGEMWTRQQENEKPTSATGWMSRAVNEVKRQVSKEHQWPEMIVRKGKLIVGGSPPQHLEEPTHQRPVLRHSHSSRTLIVETQGPEASVERVEVKIAGRLWNTRTPSPAPPPAPETPLWAPETASRTTAAIPEGISAATTPKKQTFDLPKVSGSLWNRQQPRDVVVKRGKVVVGSHLWDHAEPVQKPALRSSKSSMTIVAVEMTPGIDDAKMVEVKVAGRLWTATAPEPAEPPVVPASPLWTKESAMRTTDAIPERVIPAPRKASLDLPKLSGSLWNMQPSDVVVKKGKVVIGSHLWDHQSAHHAPVVRQSTHSRTLFPVVMDEEERNDEVSVKVGGRLWTARAPSDVRSVPTAPESPLWSKETARRTTEAIPERVAPVPRSTNVDLPKVAGSLWSTRDIAVKKGKVVVSSSLWGQSARPAQHSLPRRSHSSLVVVNVKEKEELPVVEKVEVKIGGRLWTAAMSHTPAPVIIDVPTSPLWTKQTASRTTTATPERVTPAPRKMSVDLPRVNGSLWDKHIPRDVVVRKGKIVVVRNNLWSHHNNDRVQPVLRTSRSSRMLLVEPEREQEEKEEVKVKVAGRLWSAPRPETLPATVTEEPKSPLWTKETAERSTAAVPERIAPVAPKKSSSHELPKVTGSLWDGRDVVVKKGKVVVSDRLWGQSEPVARPVMQTARSSRTVVAVEEEDEKVVKVEVKVGGRLWSAARSRAVSPAPDAVEPPKTSLWTPEAASRTTTAIPERVMPAPRKMSVQLPKATGPLWDTKRDVVVRKGKIVVDGLWNQHPKTAVPHHVVRKSKSSVVVFGVEREEMEEVKEKFEVKVGGRLWTAAVPTPAVTMEEETPLWTAATAVRTTTAAPVKTTPAPRKKIEHLPKVGGSLWAIQELHPQIKKGKVVFPTSLWSHQDQQHAPVLRRPRSSRTLFVHSRSDEEEVEVEKVKVKVAGRLWSATPSFSPSVPTVSSDIQLWTAPSPPTPAPKPVELQLAVTEPLPRPKKPTAGHTVPKASGSLWNNRSIAVKRGKVVVSENLWKQNHLAPRPVLRKSSSSRVLNVLPAEVEVEQSTWQVKVGGRLWKAETTGDVAPTVVAPLWTKETAERTTTALPERVATAPRRASIDLPKVVGTLWNGRDVTVKKGKVVVSNQLWCDHESSVVAVKKARSSRVVVPAEDKEAEEMIEVNVAGRLWTAPALTRVAAAVMSDAPLWTPETALRTTAAIPERGATAPRKMSLDLPKAIGSLWDQDISIQKRKIVINPSGLWNEPSLRPAPVLRRSTSSRMLVPASQHEHREDVTIVVAGRLWTASTAAPPPPEQDSQTLWARPSSPPTITDSSEHDDTFSKYMPLPAREIVVKKTRGGAHSVIVSGSLWSHQPTTTYRQVEISVAGRLWTAPMPAPPTRKLWTPTPEDAAEEPTVSQRLLWRRNTASRTTDAAPQRGISVPRKRSDDLPTATGALWGELEEIPPLSRMSTAASSASESEAEEKAQDVKVALRRIRSGRLWQPITEAGAELEGRVFGVNGKKGVVVVGQQRRDRYFSLGAAKREEVNPVFMETLRIGSLRRKLRVTATNVDEERERA
jgi:membrane protein implicated in regulation of membrane protease activity